MARPSSHGSHPAPPPRGKPSTNRGNRHREPEKQLRRPRITLGKRVPKNQHESDRRQEQAQPAQLAGRSHERRRHEEDECRGFGDRHPAAGNFAGCGARIRRVEARIDQTVEPHCRASRGNHTDHYPDDVPPRHGVFPRGEQRAGQRERQREHGVAEAHERQVGARSLNHSLSRYMPCRKISIWRSG